MKYLYFIGPLVLFALMLTGCQTPISDAAIQAAVQSMVDNGTLTTDQAPGMVATLTTLLANADSIDWGAILGSVVASITGTLGLTRMWRGKAKPV